MASKFDKSTFINRFKEETIEHLSELEKNLILLEKNHKDENLLAEIRRLMHTIKGGASMMGYKRISELAHKFESALALIKDGSVHPEDPHFEVLLKVLDTIRSLLEDKVAWPDKGIEYPFVIELEKKVDAIFGTAPREEEKEAAPKPKPKKAAEEPQESEETREAPAPAIAMEPVESIRVDVYKVNQMMNLVGELVVGKIGIDQRKKELEGLLSKELSRELKKEIFYFLEKFNNTIEETSLVTTQLQNVVMSVRMLPLEVIFQRFSRLVRDVSKDQSKFVTLNVTGQETELDKSVIEKIHDPLVHILRNAVGHGIEWPNERVKIGKDPVGKIDLRAYYKGSQVVIEVEDDGGGIDIQKVKDAAVRKGLLRKEEASEMPDSQAIYLLFEPGMSTAEKVSELSGRGVGLDVVKTNITALKGLVEVSSVLGKGTKFTIKIPLTLAITLALFVRSRGETFAVPLDNVIETIKISPDQIKKVERREAVNVGDEIIPLIRLGDVLGLPEISVDAHHHRTKSEQMPAVIVGVAERKIIVMVDELIGKREVVIKDLGDHLKKVPYIAGSTILGTGNVVLIMDIPSLVAEASALPGLIRPLQAGVERKDARLSILVVEDSLITRDLERSILEAAGYKVGLAKDGQDALRKLSEDKYDLVLSDVTMPIMDGFELIKKMKKDKKLNKIPVVIVSAKDSEIDKKKGLEAGASAYIVKGQFDQGVLLETIERLIG